VTSFFAYRAPDKTFWFSGERCLWHLVGDDFVRVDLPPELVSQFGFLQTITEDQQGGVWVSFGRHGLYRFANGSWTPYGGGDDLPKTGTYLMTAFTDSLGRVWFGYAKSSWRFWMAIGSVDSAGAMIFSGQYYGDLWTGIGDLDRG